MIVATILVASSCSPGSTQAGQVVPPIVVTVVVTATPEPATSTLVPLTKTSVPGTEAVAATENPESVVGQAHRQLKDLTAADLRLTLHQQVTAVA